MASVAPNTTKQSFAARGISLMGMLNSKISFHVAPSAFAPREVTTEPQTGSEP